VTNELRLDIDKETAKGQYSNLAVFSHTPNEFFLDFALMQPQGMAQVVSRIITSPQHAKALMQSLADNIRKYEAQYGPIPDLQSGHMTEGPQA